MSWDENEQVKIVSFDPDVPVGVTPSGELKVSGSIPGFSIPTFDTILASYPTTVREVYVYKLSGVTVATITVDYTDTSKQYVSQVVKS